MKKQILNAGIVLLVVVAGAFSMPQTAYAADNVCFCHNINNNPITVCTDNQGLINGHQGHVENGSDTLGACAASPTPTATPTPSLTPTITPTATPTPAEPSVPEFGLITGLLTAAMSFGSYKLLKKRS